MSPSNVSNNFKLSISGTDQPMLILFAVFKSSDAKLKMTSYNIFEGN
jgi:hypothetical protein